ncbi:MAG: T9SS type A sorting domain-containing protein [Cytophagales bacterium]|nr:T9SS type A sorting domain-containing protein [Cytophagales bacterium]
MRRSVHKGALLLLLLLAFVQVPKAQETSIAREWNEILLQAIRDDFARPTVHARNLFHSSIIMYDSWAFFQPGRPTYFLGRTIHGFETDMPAVPVENAGKEEIREVLSVAMYRLLEFRFRNSPAYPPLIREMRDRMEAWGYGAYFSDPPNDLAVLGELIAENVITYGLQDGANESSNYGNNFYETVNDALDPEIPGNPNLSDPDRWQPLDLGMFIDQSGNLIDGAIDFLSPEWGFVSPFALTEEDKTVEMRDQEMFVYHDPGPPPLFSDEDNSLYKWGFELVAIWGSHLDPADEVMWDISPGRIGNVPSLPTSFFEMLEFYNLVDGGDPSLGWDENPATGLPYEPQMVPRADYARVLAEFWADGPDSETPPGHWFTILNYVNDHPLFEKRFKGEGEVLDDLEWDVKAYFVLGGAMHDAAIAAWSIKGWHDYIRPISAIRYLADLGQSTFPEGMSYDPNGISIYDGLIELVEVGDPLAGDNDEHVGKIKLYSWRGPEYIDDPDTDLAGVGWILAENWWPYQRPTFVTPPFAGYVSGHSTFSRAAAEVMTLLTGDEFFPGGVGEFEAKQNEFLVFEEGPSQDVVLQWATYRDASDQTSLSRIWGGIHPPADDIPGRLIGIEVGIDAFNFAEFVFGNDLVLLLDRLEAKLEVFPNPSTVGHVIAIDAGFAFKEMNIRLIDLQGRTQYRESISNENGSQVTFNMPEVSAGLYLMLFNIDGQQFTRRIRIRK